MYGVQNNCTCDVLICLCNACNIMCMLKTSGACNSAVLLSQGLLYYYHAELLYINTSVRGLPPVGLECMVAVCKDLSL